MKLRGGYNVLLKGRPGSEISVMPEPEVLYLPLNSKRFIFSEICVSDGQKVSVGDVLAKDPDNHAVPLLAPRAGTVRLSATDDHIVLEDITKLEEPVQIAEKELPHIARQMGAGGIKRFKLLSLGAWQFFYDAFTGELPDPMGKPQAMIVSILSLEPYQVRGDVQLNQELLNFTRGLEQLQSLLEYEPIYLVLPATNSGFSANVREQIRGYAWAKVVEIPLKYPYDNFNILSRCLGLKKDAGPVWGVRTEGVLAVDRALTSGRACTSRIISVSGTAVKSAEHIKVPVGYPIETILKTYTVGSDLRVLNGGIFTGETIKEGVKGIDIECRGLTVLAEHKEREFLGFARIGWDRESYSNCFLSAVRRSFEERLNTAVFGELRACISCNFCEEVCPAGIMPYLIHRYLYSDLIEEADEARIDLCVECGLCSYVCPSKIELMEQFVKAKKLIAEEKEQLAQQQALEQQKALEQERAAEESNK